jgi:uncharacterized membrane protein
LVIIVQTIDMKRARDESIGSDWVVAAFAGAGVALSAYLAWTKWAAATAAFCERGSGCDIVQASRYATFLGLPTAAWGLALYATVLGLALTGPTAGRWTAAFVLAVAAVAFSAHLTYISLADLHAVCPYCLADAFIAPALLTTLLLRGPRGAGRRSAFRAGRLVGIGTIVSVATVVFAAGVFVTGATAPATYQSALAHHLAATGAVFYGAFW